MDHNKPILHDKLLEFFVLGFFQAARLSQARKNRIHEATGNNR